MADTPTAAAASQPITLAALASAFEIWERDFRAAPETFMTAEECAAAAVASLSEGRAIYMAARLRALGFAVT